MSKPVKRKRKKKDDTSDQEEEYYDDELPNQGNIFKVELDKKAV